MESDSVKNCNKVSRNKIKVCVKFFLFYLFFLLLLTSTEVTLFMHYKNNLILQNSISSVPQISKISLKLFCKCKNVINSYINGFSTLYRLLVYYL